MNAWGGSVRVQLEPTILPPWTNPDCVLPGSS